MPSSDSDKPESTSRRLVLAFDIGTTFSGASYCFESPDETSEIRNISKYPGQEHAAGSSKIPTILYYDQHGSLQFAGAEALLPENVDEAEVNGWLKVEWFKLRLRPKSLPNSPDISKLPPLPPGKKILDIYSDFMRYLYDCAERFICGAHPWVITDWQKLQSTATFVIGHPNGWEGAQQAQLRRAAIMAKLIPDNADGRERVRFISEGEASLHYCLRGKHIDTNDEGFVVADLGGGTLDFSAYKVKEKSPLSVEEVAASSCSLEGSTFVTQRARDLFEERLKDSENFGDDHTIKLLADKFDETAKKQFRGPKGTGIIKFGTVKDNDPKHGIRAGKLLIPNEDLVGLFEPAIAAAVDAIRSQIKGASLNISRVYLVGGFSGNPYLISELKERLASSSVEVSTPDGQAEKAVADGALSFLLDGYVSARVSKYSYCVTGSPFYAPHNPEHQKRLASKFVQVNRREYIKGGLFTGTSVRKETEFSQDFVTHLTKQSDLKRQRMPLYLYEGAGYPPNWVDELPKGSIDSLRLLCYVEADTSALKDLLKVSVGAGGIKFWSYDYKIVLLFGGPELMAQLSWSEDGDEKRSPAVHVVYEGSDDVDADDGVEFEEEEKEEEIPYPAPL